ncbi:hypothetical protein IMF23_07330 [Chelatococcus daeguensis]|nr:MULTISPECIES: hypothetical protein [Chelatococcus]MBM3083245.1 hypothetical protein [Chelatococcus daeguensis]
MTAAPAEEDQVEVAAPAEEDRAVVVQAAAEIPGVTAVAVGGRAECCSY